MESRRRCILVCVNNLHPPIHLPHNQPRVIGRSIETKIKSKRCSKNQVEFLADYTYNTVTARQLGFNNSVVNGQPLGFGLTAPLKHNEVIEIVAGEYQHRVEFDPVPDYSSTPPDNITEKAKTKENTPKKDKTTPQGKKRKNLDDYFSNPNKMKTEENESGVWETYDNGELLVYRKDGESSSKIAGYDLDGTLITTKSGKTYPVNYDDWQILFSEVTGTLKKYHELGYKIVILSNQGGIAIGRQTVEGMQNKISAIIKKLGVPIQAFISPGKGEYRKPAIGMWKFLLNEANGGVEVDVSKSFYVGDAAGRPAEGKRKKDFSNSDRLFALNVGLKFETPEEHFLGGKARPYDMPEFDPRKVDQSHPLYDPPTIKVPKHKLEVIVLVGFPGSGKSFFCSAHLKSLGYVVANRDSIGSWQKCVSVMENSLKEGKHVVIDNTNPEVESRQRYIDACKKLGVPVRCFILKVSKDHARHNNRFREIKHEDHSKVGDMIFNMYKSKYVEPTLKEGFDDIVKVNFVPHFENQNDEKLYKMFLNGK